jgi:hypothetical protein
VTSLKPADRARPSHIGGRQASRDFASRDTHFDFVLDVFRVAADLGKDCEEVLEVPSAERPVLNLIQNHVLQRYIDGLVASYFLPMS